MTDLRQLIRMVLTFVSFFFFITTFIVVIGYVNDYRVARSNYSKIDNPTLYLKHNITMGVKTCEAVGSPEQGYHVTELTARRSGCNIPSSILNNWQQYSSGGKEFTAKFIGEWLVMVFFGFAFLASFPCLTIGFNNAHISILSMIVALGLSVGFASFMSIQDVRKMMAPGTYWQYDDGNYKFHGTVDYYLKDSQGNLYTWSNAGFADAYGKSGLARKTNRTVE